MKELKKKAKKATEFENIKYSAYHEQSGHNNTYDQYSKGNGWDSYKKGGSADLDDDILF